MNKAPGRRPVCASCLKPVSVCLCYRFKHSPVDNSIALTILQHSQERNHPLNSTRIVKLGLKNVNVVTVADIHLEAQYVIQSMQTSSDLGWKGDVSDSDRNIDPVMGEEGVFESSNEDDNYVNGEVLCMNQDKRMNLKDIDDPMYGESDCNFTNGKDMETVKFGHMGIFSPKWKNGFETCSSDFHGCQHKSDIYQLPALDAQLQNGVDHKEVADGAEDSLIFASTVTRLGTLQKHNEQPSFSQLLASPLFKSIISNGFIVKKIHRKHIDMKFEELEEYELMIPPGSVVLFPSEKSVSIDAVDFQVKNLIVLDGTWGKAKRMCHENPWLKLLPHLRLEVKGLSLYSEVRHQPKAGCLSTVESIVCALKGLGEDCDGLDDLLGVFESMVSDQRRCKEEKMRKNSR